MTKSEAVFYYDPLEEKLNVYTHAFGCLMSIVGTILLLVRANQNGSSIQLISVAVFGLSLCVLYAASTLFHSSTEDERRKKMRIFDHAAIYVLIAGTYTPFTLVTLSDSVGWILFTVVWAMALVGIVIKLFFTGRLDRLSTLMYVFMGWLILFAKDPMLNNFSNEGIAWLLAGGISYTIGAVLYSIDRLPFNHAIFHVFVLAGSFCHFISVYEYVLI